MNVRNNRIMSFLLAFVMIAALIIGSVTVVGAADVKAIDKIMINFRNETDLALSGGEYYKHTPSEAEPDPLTGGKYSWNKEEGAMQLEYHVAQKQIPYHIMFRANKTKRLTEDYKYVAVVFRAETEETFKVLLSNSPNAGKAISMENVKGSDTYQIMKGDISALDDSGRSLQKRWLDGNINTLSFDIKGEGAKVFIKEVTFFKSMADLDAYYAAADVTKDPAEYMSDAEKAALTGAAPSTPAAPTETSKETTVPLEEQADPVFMTFDPKTWLSGNAKFCDFNENEEGVYNLKTVNGVGAIKLEYSPYGSFPDFRMMPAFKEKNLVTEDHKYIRVTYMTSYPIAAQIQMINNKTRDDKAILVENTSASKGEWVTSNAVYVGSGELIDRYMNGMHCTIGFTSTNNAAEIYIKEIGFFASAEQAYAYYGDEPVGGGVSGFVAMTFTGANSNGAVLSGNNYGENVINSDTGAVDITYAESTNQGVHYMAKLKFKTGGVITPGHRFIRVLYSADHPDGILGASLVVRNDKTSDSNIIDPAIKDTNGQFVLSNTVELAEDTLLRLSGSGTYSSAIHNSFNISTPIAGGKYSIKAVYFFTDKASADAFEGEADKTYTLSINGNDISKYQIVISKDEPFGVTNAVTRLVEHIKGLTGVTLPVVTDDTPASDYEILIGKSDRDASSSLLAEYNDGADSFKRYAAALVGNTLVVTSNLPYATEDAVDLLMSSFLYKGMVVIPEAIEINENCKYSGLSNTLGKYENWATVTNVADPKVYTEDFDSDDGYFTEDNNGQVFNIADGVMSGKASDMAMTYVHVYEKNATLAAKMSYKGAGADADFGIMLRYTGKDAFVKAGYDVANGEWYITSREGADFYTQKLGTAKAALTEGTVYNVEFTVDADTAALTVDGVKVLEVSGITQITPGRPGFYAEDVTLTVDDSKLVLLSGMGTIMQNVYHTLLPDEEYREGGSVFEMADGSMNYTHHYGVNFKSLDGGKTWDRIAAWTDYTGYVNMLRLVDGTFMKISNSGGWVCSFTSNDEGKTWVKGGQICQTPFRGDASIAAGAGNMNDKLNQSADGTIFYCQNFETTSSSFEGKKVFCEFYFSKDNGKTWTKSETDSWTISGNETEVYFGECKTLLCADGTIRMYNSWNQYGCVVYSDSTDGGKTFGPIVTMPELPCGRSSMQFYRDPYGETDTTYYMIWVNTQDNPLQDAMPRSSISLAKSTDGKTWSFLGDIWRWQSNYRYGTNGAVLNHVVDPFVKTDKNNVYVGTGLSEHTAMPGDNSYHGAQRQHIWSISKSTLGEGTPITAIEYLGSFTDVHTGNSYYDAVKYAVEAGLFNGTSETTFSPAASMTRAMFVTVLGRLAKADVAAYATPTFSDVLAGQWYTSYVEWAAANGIVNGLGNGIYGINDNVTVEQACVILARYADYKAAATQTGKTAADFTDGANVASWSAKEVDWAIANGIYNGAGASLNPTSAASRATVATMFANYVKAFG